MKPMLLMASLQLVSLPFVSSKSARSQYEQSTYARRIEAWELKESMEEWDRDYAVLFHTTWCAYCRQFKPIWNQIALLNAKSRVKNLDIVTFDCESSTENKKLCIYAGVQQYPSVMFVGHGSYMQNDPISSRFKGVSLSPEKTIMYQGELYLTAVHDWTRTMRFISTLSRWHSNIQAMLGRRPSLATEVKRLRRENAALQENQMTRTGDSDGAIFSKQHQELINKFKTNEDPFSVLSMGSYGYNKSMSNPLLPAIRQCVAEVAWEHCSFKVKAGDSSGGSEYCGILLDCYASDFSKEACRPQTCPLDEPGCLLTSICMHPDIIKRYISSDKKASAAQDKSTHTSQRGGWLNQVRGTGGGITNSA